jgi:hypothetical protein
MTEGTARAIADLINSQNQLTTRYTAQSVLRDRHKYIVRIRDHQVTGAIEVEKASGTDAE